MAELNDLQWAFGAAMLITFLVIGGWLSRKRVDEDINYTHDNLKQLTQLQEQLEKRDSELQDAREEAELILLQLHQVQEELEHYFLKCCKMEQMQTIDPKQLEQLKRINSRMLKLFKTLPNSDKFMAISSYSERLKVLTIRQQNALRRFQALQKAS